jgi:hypothetical protein
MAGTEAPPYTFANPKSKIHTTPSLDIQKLQQYSLELMRALVHWIVSCAGHNSKLRAGNCLCDTP